MAVILILEDRAIDRTLLATVLRSAGHAVIEASDGVEGLRLAEGIPPDLVISDILMPTMDGYEFVRRMRDVPALARTPVIFYTATYHEREVTVELLNASSMAEGLFYDSNPICQSQV